MIINPYAFGAPVDPTVPLWANVILALHGDGSNGSTTIVDSKNSYVPDAGSLGGVAISTTVSAFGGASIKFPASGGLDYTVGGIDNNFKFPGDFFWRGFVYWDGTFPGGNPLAIIDTRDSAGSAVGFVFYVDASGLLTFYSGIAFEYTAAATFPVNTLVYLVISRAGSTITIGQDGTAVASFTNGANFSSGRCAIGLTNSSYSNPAVPWSGYMDEVQLVKGQPAPSLLIPTGPFPNF